MRRVYNLAMWEVREHNRCELIINPDRICILKLPFGCEDTQTGVGVSRGDFGGVVGFMRDYGLVAGVTTVSLGNLAAQNLLESFGFKEASMRGECIESGRARYRIIFGKNIDKENPRVHWRTVSHFASSRVSVEVLSYIRSWVN